MRCVSSVVPTMIPARSVPADDLMEVVFAISQAGSNVTQEKIEEFTGFGGRKVRESIKMGEEIGLIVGDDHYTVANGYRQKINEISKNDRDVILNRALIQYRPFRVYGTYIRKGYTPDEAARRANAIYEVASEWEYLDKHFRKLGSYAGILDLSSDTPEVTIQDREIPTSSVESVESLRDTLASEAEVRFYLEETIGDEVIQLIDTDTEDELVKSFLEHAESPRDSITASGRAIEDFLRDLGKRKGEGTDAYESANGTGELADGLKNDAIIREVQKKRAHALSAIRVKGGAHGDDQRTGERWDVGPEIALSTAMETTLLIGSIGKLIANGDQVL